MVGNLRAIPYAPTIGGTVTIASYPPMAPTFNDCGEQIVTPYRSSTIRLSVGLEDPDDIIAELDEALTASLDEGHSATKGSV
jgi:cystathionine beta-lyase/cystathionine gamma-synthase